MDQAQFDLFRSITLEYLTKLAPDDPGEPEFGEAYLQFGDPVLLEYTSLVRISGEFQGAIYITAPASVIRMLLELHGEPDVSQETLEDMSRELSNVLAGNASHAFGVHWQISVPSTITRQENSVVQLPDSGFVMPIEWRGQEIFLVIGLTDPQADEEEAAHAA